MRTIYFSSILALPLSFFSSTHSVATSSNTDDHYSLTSAPLLRRTKQKNGSKDRVRRGLAQILQNMDTEEEVTTEAGQCVPSTFSYSLTNPPSQSLSKSWTSFGQNITLNTDNYRDFVFNTFSISSDGRILAVSNSIDGGRGRKHRNRKWSQMYKMSEDNSTWLKLGQEISMGRVFDVTYLPIKLSGDGMVVAMPWHDMYRVYSYNLEKDTWVQMGPNIYRRDGSFPSELDLSSDGRTLAISRRDNPTGTDMFLRVYNYDNISAKWVQVGGDIVSSEGWEFRKVTLSADGKTLMADKAKSNTLRREVDLYSLSMSTEGGEKIWKRMTDTIELMGFVHVSLSANGQTLAVGVYTRQDLGSVRVYTLQNDEDNNKSVWIPMGQELTGADVGSVVADFFGIQATLSENGCFLAVTSLNNGEGVMGPNTGHIFPFSFNGTAWIERGEAIHGNISSSRLGFDLVLSDDGMVIGATEHPYRPSTVRTFRFV